MSIKKGSRTIASSVPVTEWGSIDGTLADQADIKSALDSKADTYSPTFTGTPLAPTAPIDVSNNQIATTRYVQEALLNAGGDLPEQEGQSGKFLTTNGQLPSWANVDALPSQAGNNGKYLITNGTTASWSTLNGVVHLTGDETIAGVKTFNNVPEFNGGVGGTDNKEGGEIHLAPVNNDSSYNFGVIDVFSSTSDDTSTHCIRMRMSSGNSGISVYNDGHADVATAPSASNSTSLKNIPTVGWVNDPILSTNVVHRSGNETITGVKTFTNYSPIKLKNTNYALNDFTDEYSTGVIEWIDKNNTQISYLKAHSSTAGNIWNEFAGTYGTNDWKCGLKVGYNSTEDRMFTWAPNPITNSNDNSIATTSWVNTKVNGITLTSGNDITIDNKAINYTGTKYYRLSTRTWTYAQWTQYCERGVTTNISPSYTVTGIKAGDLVTVEGICSDRNNANVLAWGIANGGPAAETNNVSVTFLGLNIQNDAGLVHTTGNESISGLKTFTSNLLTTTTNAAYFGGLLNQSTGITKGTAPSALCGSVISLQDSTSYGSSTGRIASLVLGYEENKNSFAQLMAYEPVLNSTNSASIRVVYPASGEPYTVAPTPSSATDNSTKIATTAWVNTRLGGTGITSTELGYLDGVTSNIQTQLNGKLSSSSSLLVPVGTVIAYAANSAPSGYLICNGAAVSRTTYADLFAKIGTIYGAGDSSTTFNLPNLTDKFIQGSGTSGTSKAAGLPNIKSSGVGDFSGRPNATQDGALSVVNMGGDNVTGSGSTWYKLRVALDASKSSSIYGNSTTVQPPALTMRYYIKY